jgi:GAF domain-containing protein
MRRRSIAGGKPAKTRRRKSTASKSRVAPDAARPRASSAAKETTVARLSRELDRAVQQQAATVEVLKVISRSTFDLQAVLNTLLESAARLCEADKGSILRPTGNGASYYSAASYRHTPAYIKLATSQTFGPGRVGTAGRVLLEGKSVQIADVLADPEYKLRKIARAGGFRTILGVPLLREGVPIGIFLLHRVAVRPFTQKQIELVETFAAQAVIAIENTRLFEEVQGKTRDLEESLQQQTATADVLKVISRSTFDLEPVLATVAEMAARLCEAEMVFVSQSDGDVFRYVTAVGSTPEAMAGAVRFQDYLNTHPISPASGRKTMTGRVISECRAVQIADITADPEYNFPETFNLAKIRTLLGVPLMREGKPIGIMNLARQRVERFTERQIELVRTFADQAVIAIENTRLLTEQREALEQQTATGDVLKIISRSPADLETVLDTLVETVARLCRADQAVMWRRVDDLYHVVAWHGLSEQAKKFVLAHPVASGRGTVSGRAALERKPVHITDVLDDPEYTYNDAQRIAGYRSFARHPAPARRHLDWHIQHSPYARRSIHDQGDRARLYLRRPGSDRDRECTSLRGAAQSPGRTARHIRQYGRWRGDVRHRYVPCCVES